MIKKTSVHQVMELEQAPYIYFFLLAPILFQICFYALCLNHLRTEIVFALDYSRSNMLSPREHPPIHKIM